MIFLETYILFIIRCQLVTKSNDILTMGYICVSEMKRRKNLECSTNDVEYIIEDIFERYQTFAR